MKIEKIYSYTNYPKSNTQLINFYKGKKNIQQKEDTIYKIITLSGIALLIAFIYAFITHTDKFEFANHSNFTSKFSKLKEMIISIIKRLLHK